MQIKNFLKLYKNFVCVTEYKNNLILLNNISQWFLVTTKLFARWNIPIVSGLVVSKNF